MNSYISSKPAISREVIKDPVYTLSTANPCSSCNWGTAFPAAIINSIPGVAPSLKFLKQQKNKWEKPSDVQNIQQPDENRMLDFEQHYSHNLIW